MFIWIENSTLLKVHDDDGVDVSITNHRDTDQAASL